TDDAFVYAPDPGARRSTPRVRRPGNLPHSPPGTPKTEVTNKGMSERKLDGKTAVITGAGRGLGRAMALALSSAGARVGLVARTVEQLNETAAAIHKLGGVA